MHNLNEISFKIPYTRDLKEKGNEYNYLAFLFDKVLSDKES